MRRKIIAGIMVLALVATSICVVSAGQNFVDADGDGICDNMGIYGRDDNDDGIPNGQDDDYVQPLDGSGMHRGKGQNGDCAQPQDGRGKHNGNRRGK
ncbi:MAG: hypothetical protein U9N61_04095 [Euryarchaeota archaeon]|nr:hypothetical protein [Euryarchaeota archaeon]